MIDQKKKELDEMEAELRKWCEICENIRADRTLTPAQAEELIDSLVRDA